jgi:maleylacetoacetate isomerase
VPVLVIPAEATGARPQVLAQSMAILAYLEERFPTTPLLPPPGALFARAKARQLAEMIKSGIQPFQNLTSFAWMRAAGVVDPAGAAREFNARGLAAVEQLSSECAGKFLVGDSPTIADIYLTRQPYGARRFDLDLTPYPTLLRVEAAAAAQKLASFWSQGRPHQYGRGRNDAHVERTHPSCPDDHSPDIDRLSGRGVLGKRFAVRQNCRRGR